MSLPLSDLYPLKAGGVFVAIMAIAMSRRRHHPFARFGPANQITAVRALLVALLAGLIDESPVPMLAWSAVVLGTIAALLDGLDGWLARRTQMLSVFGARFDTEVDALLVQVLAILAWLYAKAGPWVIVSGLLRYVFVAAGWIWPWMRRPLVPTFRGRLICVVQIAALITAIGPIIEPRVSTLVAAAGLLALVYSFLVDTLRLWQGRSAVSCQRM